MMLEALATNLVVSCFDKTWSQISKTQEASLVRCAARDRLQRELRLNLEVWKLTRRSASSEQLAELLSMDAFDEVMSLSAPLKVLFLKNALSAKAIEYLLRDNIDKRFKKWSANINNEVELVERTWYRLRVLKVRRKINGSVGSLAYLMHLHEALDIALKGK